MISLGEAFGDFLLPEPAQPVLFIAGGSGITPVLSHLETMAAQDFRAPVNLLYFVRTQQDIHSTFFSAAPPALSADLSGQILGGKVRFEKSGLETSSEGDASLLDMAEASGLTPRHGCRMGICHQCSCRKTSGTVINRLTGQHSGPGEESVQLCISIPHGPVTIDA